MAALFASPSTPAVPRPPEMPKSGSDEVRKAGDDRLRVSYGRAANYLTNPSATAEQPPVNKQPYLGTV